MKEQANVSAAYCLFMKNSPDGTPKPVLIAFDDMFIEHRRLGTPIYDDYDNSVIFGDDGYNYYKEQPMPQEWLLHLTWCHEVAHSMIPVDYWKEHPDGHGPRHEHEMRQLMTALHPNFKEMPYHHYWTAP